MASRVAPAPLDLLPTRLLGGARFVGRELAIWAAVYGAYLAVRGQTIGAPARAVAHARDVIDVERALGLFHEGGFQRQLAPVADVFSAYYMLGFAPVIGVTLIWLAIRDAPLYRRLRTALLVSIAMATVVYVLYPTAPPRLVPGLGITDTVGLSSHDSGSFMGIRFNPYASVPSMHVGWSLLVACFASQAVRRRSLRILCFAHPLLMTVTVAATGNHYFLDAIAGAGVAGATLLLLLLQPARRANRLSRRCDLGRALVAWRQVRSEA